MLWFLEYVNTSICFFCYRVVTIKLYMVSLVLRYMDLKPLENISKSLVKHISFMNIFKAKSDHEFVFNYSSFGLFLQGVCSI